MRIDMLRNLLMIVSMLLLVGCGGGSSYTPNNLDDNTTIPDNNGTVPDDNGTTPDDNGTVPDDNGTTPDDNGTVLSKGTATASKGPFRAGALVTAYRLNEELQRTGEYKETNTTDDKGTFSIELPWTGLTEINVVGDYYNELTGTYMSDGNLSTFVYMQGGGDNPVGVNVATHMMHEMMKKRVEDGNTSDYEEIEKEAEETLKEFFGLDDNLSLGELNITDDGRESRQLLALSLAIASSDNPNELMGELSVDIADDGEIDDEGQGAYEELQGGFDDIDKKLEQAVENMQNDINGTKATKTSNALDGTLSMSTTIKFDRINSAYLDTNYTSNEVTVDGIIGDEAEMKLVVGEVYYRLNGADPVLLTAGSSVMVTNGDLLALQAISASTYETRTVNKIEIGGKTFKFVIKTMKDPFVADDEPDDFTFGFIGDAKVGQDYESSIVVSGINVASPISIEDGEYSIDGGAFTTVDGTVENDDNVTVRLTASDDFGDKTKAIVTIGGVDGKFIVKTERKDNTPDAITFESVVGVDKSEVVESGEVTVSGINTDVTAKIRNGKLSVNGQAYVSEAQVEEGDTIKLQVTAPSSYDASKEYVVRVGRIATAFEVQTMSNPVVPDTTPDAFAFGAKSVDTAGIDVLSNIITVASINQEVDISVSGGSYKINNGSFTTAQGKVKEGDKVQLQVTSPDYGKQTTATLTIGGVQGTFTVNTNKDDTPDSGVSFTTQMNADRDVDVESNAITITGINVPIPVKVDGGEVSVNGGAYTATPGNVSNGQTLKVKLRSSAKANDFSLALVSVGTGLNLPFVVKTKAAKPVFGTVPTLSATEDSVFKAELAPYLTEGVSTQWTISGNPTWLMINPLNGQLLGAPKGDESVGTHTVTVTATNGSGSGSVTFDIVVADFNYAPVLTTSLPAKSVAEDSAAFTIPLASTDQDSKDTATYSAKSSNVNVATVAVSGSTLTVTPVANANGRTDITVTVTDKGDGTNSKTHSKTFTLTVTPVNDAPVLAAIANQTVAEDATLAPITLSAADVDTGDTITYKATSLDTSKATVKIVGNQLTVTPVANANGTVSIDVYANDGTVNSNKQTFTVTITPVPDAPILAAIPAKSMKEDDAPLVVTLSATDADGDTAITYSATSSNESLVTTSVNGNQLTLTLAADENGEADITVKATDSTGLVSNEETLKLTVTAVNDKPVLAVINPQEVDEDNNLTITLSATDTENDAVTYSATSSNDAVAKVEVDGDQLTVIPQKDKHGSVDITVTPKDSEEGTPQTFTVTINPMPDSPVLQSIDNQSMNEDGEPLVVPVSAIDADGDNLTYSATSSDEGLATVAVNGSQLTITPVANKNGSVTITVKATDDSTEALESNEESFVVTINPMNDAPVVTAIDDMSVNEDDENSPFTISLSATDIDGDTAFTYKAESSDPSIASVQIVNGNQLELTLQENQNGAVTISVIANDGTDDSEAAETFVVNITAVPDAPVLAAVPAQSMKEDDAPLVVTLSATDADGDTAITYSATSSNESLVTTSVNGNQLTLTLVADENGEADITVKATDSTSLDSNVETFKLTVTAVNDKPVLAVINPQEVAEDNNLTITLSATDTEDDAVTYSATSSNEAIAKVEVDGDQLTVIPQKDKHGSVDITVTPKDSEAGTPKTFTVTINPMPDSPVLQSIDNQSMNEDGEPLVVPVSATDADDGDNVTYSATSSDEGLATVAVNGSTLTITPVANQNGSVTITVKATDDSTEALVSNEESFVVTINPMNDAPVVTAIDDISVNEDDENSPFTIDLSATDIDGDTAFTYKAESSDPSIASVQIVNGNQLELTLQENQNGAVTISVIANDGALDSEEAETFVVNIEAVNDAPELNIDAMQKSIEQDQSLDTVPTVIDPDAGDTHTFTLTGNKPAWMSIDSQTGHITGTPSATDVTETPIEGIILTVTDSENASDSATFSFMVKDKNDIPTISGNPATEVAVGDTYSFIPTGADADANDVLTYSIENKPEWAEFNTSNGELKGIPMFLDIGTSDSITIRVTDGTITEDVALAPFTITVVDDTDVTALTLPALPIMLYRIDEEPDNSMLEYEEITLDTDNILKTQEYDLEDNGSFVKANHSYKLVDGQWTRDHDMAFEVNGNYIDLLDEDARIDMIDINNSVAGADINFSGLIVTMPEGAFSVDLRIRSYGDEYNLYGSRGSYDTLDAFIADYCEQGSLNGYRLIGDNNGDCSMSDGQLAEVDQSGTVTNENAGKWMVESVDGVDMLVLYLLNPMPDDESILYGVFDDGTGSKVWEGGKESFQGESRVATFYNEIAMEAVKQKAVDKALGIVARFTPEMLSDKIVWNVFPENNDTTGEHWYEAATFEFTSTSLSAQLGIVNSIDEPLVEANYDITDIGQLHFVDSEDGSENYITIVGLTEDNMTVCWSDTAAASCSVDELEFIYFDQSVAQAALDQFNESAVRLPDGYTNVALNSDAQEVFSEVDGYIYKVYTNQTVSVNPQSAHAKVAVVVNGTTTTVLNILEVYRGKNIVVGITSTNDGKLILVSAIQPVLEGTGVTKVNFTTSE